MSQNLSSAAVVIGAFRVKAKGKKNNNHLIKHRSSVACKVLKHMVHSNVMRHLDQDILKDKQHDFMVN